MNKLHNNNNVYNYIHNCCHTPNITDDKEEAVHSYHIYTKSTPQHTHHHSAPFVALTNIPHNISSVAHRYPPRYRPWICGGIPPA